MRPTSRRSLICLALILLVGAALRLYQLDTVPPGFQFDEAYNALDAVRVMEGSRDIFFPANGGREPLYTYWHAFLFRLLGVESSSSGGFGALFALRLASALAGILTLPLAFGAVRYLFRSHPRANALALLTSGFLAVNFWHLHFSHYAIRAITLPPILLATLWAFWYGQASGQFWAFAVAGVAMAAGVYAHPAARFLPLLLILFTLYDTTISDVSPVKLNLFSRNPQSRFRNWLGLILAGLVSFLLFLPLGMYFLKHPWLFTGHPGDVSVFDSRVNQGDLAGTLLRHALQLAGMFLWRGDPTWLHNLPGRPVFEPISGLAFLIGVLVWVRALLRSSKRASEKSWGRLSSLPGQTGKSAPHTPSQTDSRGDFERRPYVYLGLWIVVMVLPSLFSDYPPNYSRAIGALPAICVFPALGLVAIWDLIERRGPISLRIARSAGAGEQGSKRAGETDFAAGSEIDGSKGEFTSAPPHLRTSAQTSAVVLAAFVLLVSGLWTARDYYFTFAQDPEAYYWYDGDKEEVADVLEDLAAQGQVYMAPPWVKHATVDFLTRGWGIKEVALGTGVVLPNPTTAQDAYYVLRAKDAGESRFARRLLGPAADETVVHDRFGEPLVFVHHLPVQAIPDEIPGPTHEMHVVFGDLFEFLGYTMNAPVKADERLDIILFWRSLQPAPLNYTQFIHLLDQDGQRWGQRDREPLDTTYRTSEWEPGEVIIDRFRIEVDPAAPPGTYTLLVGWYDLKTGKRLPIAGSTDTAVEITGLEMRAQ